MCVQPNYVNEENEQCLAFQVIEVQEKYVSPLRSCFFFTQVTPYFEEIPLFVPQCG